MPSTGWSATDILAGTIIANSNLLAAAVGGTGGGVRSQDAVSSGKYYWECTANSFAGANTGFGIATAGSTLNGVSNAVLLQLGSGLIFLNGGASTGPLSGVVIGSTIGVAMDASAQLIWMRVCPSGNWNGSGTANPATGTGGFSFAAIGGGTAYYAMANFNPSSGSSAISANFGTKTFSGALPSGFTSGIPGANSVAAPTNELVTFVSGGDRNNLGSFVGLSFQVLGGPLPVSQLGLRKGTGTTGVHTAYLNNGVTHTTIASATIDLTSTAVGSYAYASCSPTSIGSGTTYQLVTKGNSGDGQNWANAGDCVLSLDFFSPQSIYNGSTTDQNSAYSVNSTGQMFYGVDLVYGSSSGGAVQQARAMVLA